MTEFTIEDLKRIMHGSAGGGDDAEDAGYADADYPDTEYAALGYDSLAVLEIQSQIENTLDLTLPDDALSRMRTPRDTVAVVNACLAGEEGALT
ncbi:acyl carrier protein [Streptomyces sp. B1866]|uniref:acyl carrier protein n=1 Tax=Streptomyces sp. B1866 TaxID=3075431 RepID=UPI0028906EC3|nr:acyl carrier protein [Streptomyces sp. B1866]MDT3397873.1 acyl carrier protein [Streptomyces sp. B1866]